MLRGKFDIGSYEPDVIVTSMKIKYWLYLMLIPLVICGAFVLYKTQENSNEPTVLDESKQERDRSMKAAFRDNSGSPKPGQELEFHNIAQTHFTNLAKAFQGGHGTRIGRYISGEEMFNYAERAGLFKLESDRYRKGFKKGFIKGLESGFSNSGNMMGYDDAEIVRIEIISDNEFIAYTKLWDDEYEIYSKMRWWLLKDKHDNWVIYDYEDFDSNIRVSTLLGLLVPAPGKKTQVWTKEFSKMVRQYQSTNSDNMEEALIELGEQAKKFLKHKDLPAEIRSFSRLMLIGSLLVQEQYQEALDQIELLEASKSDAPVLAYNKGLCLVGLERWDEAIEYYTKYSKLLGWDSDLHEVMADAYFKKGDLLKTAEHARKGLQGNANAIGCLASLAASIPEADFDQITKDIAKSKDQEESYEVVMDYLIAVEKIDRAKALFKKFKQAFPQSELIEYYEEEFEKPVKDEEKNTET